MEQSKIDEAKHKAGEALHAKVDELAAAHGEIAVVVTDLGPAIFRKPSRAEYKRHLSLLFGEKTKPEAIEFLARACVVHPSKIDFDKWLDDKPGIPIVCAEDLTALAGASKAEGEGK